MKTPIPNNKKLILILFLPIQWLLFSYIGNHPHFVETWYSQGLFKWLSLILRGATARIPFSVGEIILYLLISVILFLIIRGVIRIVKHKAGIINTLKKLIVNILAVSSLIYFLFMILWGLNYHREPLVRMTETEFTTAELKGLCELLIEKTNKNKNLILSTLPDKRQIIIDAVSSYKDLKIGDKYLDYKIPSVKTVIFTGLFSYLGVTGIYNPFTAEANVNADPPLFLLPATVCHEMAHQAGIAPENEANYAAFVVCSKNANPLFRYSGYLMAMRYAMSALSKSDPAAFSELKKKISTAVKADIDLNRKYWAKFKNPFEKYSDKVYDNYLKANNQKAGIKSYGLMVTLLLNDYKEKGDI